MQVSRIRRQPRQLVLDGLFVLLLCHFLVTGALVPQVLIDLFHDEPQIVVSTEPASVPDSQPPVSPILEDGDALPETRILGYGAGSV